MLPGSLSIYAQRNEVSTRRAVAAPHKLVHLVAIAPRSGDCPLKVLSPSLLLTMKL